MKSDAICALATAAAPAALAVIRVSGPDVIELVATCTDREDVVAATPGGRVRTVHLVDRSGVEAVPVDEVVLTVWRAPASYTGEDMVEITCHGGRVGVERILGLLVGRGLRPAEPGEFTQRAFVNGRIDLTRAEAVHELVTSRSTVAHQLAIHRLGGGLAEAIDAVKHQLVGQMATVAVAIDYPDDEHDAPPLDEQVIAQAEERLGELLGSWASGSLYQQGATVVLAGAVNAGKSSLFNALVRRDRAIVSATPGTTRDYLEAEIEVGGVPVRLYDTAGLREAGEEIEGEGMRRTRELAHHADLVVEVVDGTNGAGRDVVADARIRVWNKVDAPECAPAPEGYIATSARTHTGVDAVLEALRIHIAADARPPSGAVVVESARQRDLLARSVAALARVREGIVANTPVDLVAIDLQEALGALGEITGEVTSDEILDAVFGSFCLGK